MNTYETTRRTPAPVAHRHRAQQGFCTVCGSAWPCYRGRRAELPATLARVVPVLL